MRTDDPADYFRSKMAETAVLAYLFDLLQDKSGDIQRSSIKIIIALARFGRLIYHFVPCED